MNKGNSSQDGEGPQTSCDLCLAQVCGRLEALCRKRADGSMSLIWAPSFPQELADQSSQKMATKGMSNDTTVGIFRNCKQLRSRRASIRRSKVSAEAFRSALCPHRLSELDASWVRGGLTGADVISGSASNPECRASSQKLALNGLSSNWGSLEEGGGVSVGFSSLQGLRTIHLVSTDLSDGILEDICSLPQSENSDISCSTVSDLNALSQCKNTMRTSIAHRLHRSDMSPVRSLFVFTQLPALRHSDFSEDHFAGVDSDRRDGDELVRQLSEGGRQVLPSLVSIDISGRKTIAESSLTAFLESRSGLVFLGSLATGLSSCPVLSSQKNLKVTGEATETQLWEALTRYRERECFVREALFHLYSSTTDTDKPQPDTSKLVVEAMQSHPESPHVQSVATACVFNLITQDSAEAMPVSSMSSTVSQSSHAMKTFPDHHQVQKNCSMALCSDYLSQDVPFDKYLAAMSVVRWSSNHEEPTSQRMAVAVISISVAKSSVEETANLSKDVSFMKQSSAVVQQKAMSGVLDSSLKFASSASWNSTDETPTAARNFIECEGLELYEEVSESYYNEPSIQQKVLGLLNNIAEVEELQSDSMDEDSLEHILSLSQDSQLEVGVRYFAGGISAQSASRAEAWTSDHDLRSIVSEQSHKSIIAWPHSEQEMVSYRSFRPFCPSLQTCQPPGVQSWAVWAIHLVCSQNPSRYSSRLDEEGVTELSKALDMHPDTHGDVKRLSQGIVSMAQEQQSHSQVMNGQTEPGNS